MKHNTLSLPILEDVKTLCQNSNLVDYIYNEFDFLKVKTHHLTLNFDWSCTGCNIQFITPKKVGSIVHTYCLKVDLKPKTKFKELIHFNLNKEIELYPESTNMLHTLKLYKKYLGKTLVGEDYLKRCFKLL